MIWNLGIFEEIMNWEDIDCSVELKDQGGVEYYGLDPKLTLSGLLNFFDGLWLSCGDERIIIFTTNYKDQLDPALLLPGRMDMHIHMSYCTSHGFKLLANNYLGIQNNQLFGEIDYLIDKAQVTLAEVAEELMKSDNADVTLGGLVKLLERKMEGNEQKDERFMRKLNFKKPKCRKLRKEMKRNLPESPERVGEELMKW